MRGFFPTTANAADSKGLQALHAARRPLRWAQDCHNPSEQTTMSWDVCFRPGADVGLASQSAAGRWMAGRGLRRLCQYHVYVKRRLYEVQLPGYTVTVSFEVNIYPVEVSYGIPLDLNRFPSLSVSPPI